jgi:polyribonucleotide nucleotidyltransferase
VKVLAVEGNRIRLSRKAILKEQRAKMGGGEPGPEGGEPSNGEVAGAPALTIEGGGDFPDDEPNFNRDAVAGVAGGGGGERAPADRPDRGGDRGRGGRPGGGGGGRGRGRGRGPGGGGRGGHGGGHGGPRH